MQMPSLTLIAGVLVGACGYTGQVCRGRVGSSYILLLGTLT